MPHKIMLIKRYYNLYELTGQAGDVISLYESNRVGYIIYIGGYRHSCHVSLASAEREISFIIEIKRIGLGISQKYFVISSKEKSF